MQKFINVFVAWAPLDAPTFFVSSVSFDMVKAWKSNEKFPGCLGYIGDEILPSYVGITS